MTILATSTDIENFVMERSPHVKDVEVFEHEDEYANITYIKITLSFWYRFFFEKTFYRYITKLIDEYKMMGVEYDIIITS